jgi:chorismate mutase/prephenate dehydratase
MSLNKPRQDINAIDDEILELLVRRRKVTQGVLEAKQKGELPLRDVEREEELLARLIRKGRELGIEAHAVTKIFHEVIDDSLRSQQLSLQRSLNVDDAARPLRIAYQGIDGAYSHLAARKFFADREEHSTFSGCPTFAAVVDAVEEGVADYALLPVENTTAGSINDVYDLLLRTKLSIVGEEVFRIDHCLLAIEDVPLSKIRRILSHWQALAQCTRFLAQLENCQMEPFADTALAVRKVKEDQDLSQAAIASEEAASHYGLRVLHTNINDQAENFTRFIVVAGEPIRVDPRIPAKTSLIMATAHEAGALLKALAVLQRHEINLTKLESRPRKGSPFEYLFYLDFEGNLDEPRVEEALIELRGATSFLKILGSYPIEIRGKTAPTMRALVGEPTRGVAPAASGEVAPGDTASGPVTEKPNKVGYQLASRDTKSESTIVRVRDVAIGGDEFVVIAGPCSVESEEQIRACARQVKECGGKILRGGCFKPRTSPYSFRGLGFEGLELLARAGREYGLPIITEVLSPSDVEKVAEMTDILQIGARNMQNFSLLSEVGQVDRPVMLKRGLSASLEEFLNAAEYILAQGNQQVVLCERGIRTFETTTRNTLDLGAIPILKKLTHLPIVVDPSHAAGERELVLPLALAAHAVGPHAMMVEIHPQPEKALSDGPQALRFEEFAKLMAEIFG